MVFSQGLRHEITMLTATRSVEIEVKYVLSQDTPEEIVGENTLLYTGGVRDSCCSCRFHLQQETLKLTMGMIRLIQQKKLI